MRDATAQELLLLTALHECRMRLDEARKDASSHASVDAALTEARQRIRALEEEVGLERERTEAVRLVLRALTVSIGLFGLRRQIFQKRIARLGRETPQEGLQAARHAVLLEEARRVLGYRADAAQDRAG